MSVNVDENNNVSRGICIHRFIENNEIDSSAFRLRNNEKGISVILISNMNEEKIWAAFDSFLKKQNAIARADLKVKDINNIEIDAERKQAHYLTVIKNKSKSPHCEIRGCEACDKQMRQNIYNKLAQISNLVIRK